MIKYDNERKKNVLAYTKEFISKDELTETMKTLNMKKDLVEKENSQIETELRINKKSEETINNLSLLKEILENHETEDRLELHKMFKLLIEKILIDSKYPNVPPWIFIK